ncbi:hypothetical protein ACQY0O_008391 [Thecaphora frezii]
MLRPAAVASLLSQLVHSDPGPSDAELAAYASRPHTALLSLLETSELYAYVSRLGESESVQPPSGARLARRHARSKSIPLSLDERAMCLSAIAVAAWRNATSATASTGANDPLLAGPGMRVHISRHSLGALEGLGKKVHSQDLVPLLLECELGRILVMPIVPVQPPASTTPPRTDSNVPDRDDEGQAATSFSQGYESSRPFMLLTLNAPLPSPPASGTVVAAADGARSHLRSGGATPSSMASEATETGTALRSPVSDGSPTPEAAQGNRGVAWSGEASELAAAAQDASSIEEEEAAWGIMYAQAKALARHLAPSLAKCGVGVGINDDENGDGRHSAQAMSEDEHEE